MITLHRKAASAPGGHQGDHGRLTVLHSMRGLGPSSNPYLAQLLGNLPGDVTSHFFSWRFALLGRYDVLHLQWPELLVRGAGRLRTAGRLAGGLLLLARLRLTRTAVVRTVHNLAPHDAGGRVERRVLAGLDRATSVWIRLNDDTPLPAGAPAFTILHGHYRDHVASLPRAGRRPRQVVFFGLIRSYKGVSTLVDAFRAVPDPTARLLVAGKPDPAGVATELRDRAGADQRIDFRFEYVPDAELPALITAAQLVVLPYQEIHNSGAALLALSLDRPVLVPDAPTTRSLRREVGQEWVLTYQGPLTGDVLGDALDATADLTGRPDLGARDWADAGREFRAAYDSAVQAAGRRRYSANT
jgi:beta-1,4-mannosyltransferase